MTKNKQSLKEPELNLLDLDDEEHKNSPINLQESIPLYKFNSDNKVIKIKTTSKDAKNKSELKESNSSSNTKKKTSHNNFKNSNHNEFNNDSINRPRSSKKSLLSLNKNKNTFLSNEKDRTSNDNPYKLLSENKIESNNFPGINSTKKEKAEEKIYLKSSIEKKHKNKLKNSQFFENCRANTLNTNNLRTAKDLTSLPVITNINDSRNITTSNSQSLNKQSKNYGLNKQNTVIKNSSPLELSFGDSINDISQEDEIKRPKKKGKSENKNKIKFSIPENNDKNHHSKKKRSYDYKKIQTINNGYLCDNKFHKKYILLSDSKKPDIFNLSNLNVTYPNFSTVKCSINKINEHISCYAVNTYKGLMKNHNEDKVSIIHSIAKSKDFNGYWPKCSFLGLYNGKFGKSCSNFLRDELHNFIIKNKNFPKDPIKAINEGFTNAEKEFQKKISETPSDKSGSCALIALFIDDKVYIANCGDSRAILSMNNGKDIKVLNKIHRITSPISNEKICEQSEIKRIKENGGKILLTKTGKAKILPGKLSITRSFGYENLKNEKFGGKEGVIIEKPDIEEIKINDKEFDYLILGSNGIFQKLTSVQSIKCIQNLIDEQNNLDIGSIHQLAGSCVDVLIKTSLIMGSADNVTCIFIGFNNFGLNRNSDCNSDDNNKRDKKDKDKQRLKKNFERAVTIDIQEVKDVDSEEFEPDEIPIDENENNEDYKEKIRQKGKMFTIRDILSEIKAEQNK